MSHLVPELFWISGSPPSWRVMLALAAKGIAFTSRRLDSAKGEHKSAAYLALNPRGQVPLLRIGNTTIRESVAIIAMLEHYWPEQPLFGHSPAESALIWQTVLDFEMNVRPSLATIAQILFRGEVSSRCEEFQAASNAAQSELDALENDFTNRTFAATNNLSAADCILYPTLAWTRRAIARTDQTATVQFLDHRLNIASWMSTIERLPFYAGTYPPHWVE